jgi:hypothetical protein
LSFRATAKIRNRPICIRGNYCGNSISNPKVTTMAKDLLGDMQCRNATSQGKKLVKLSDGDGLYLWVYEDGRKYWRLRYWVDGKEKGLSLGVYPTISLKAARKGCAVRLLLPTPSRR